MSRNCDGCTKCCDGWLSGTVNGRAFWPGRPCHFVAEKGCTIYKKRPETPCKQYECQWLTDEDVPEWMKPSIANVLITKREVSGISYWHVSEAGAKISVEVLSWLFSHCLGNGINFTYNIGNGHYKFGSPEFINLNFEPEPTASVKETLQ